MTRPVEPQRQVVSARKSSSGTSKLGKRYPKLNLSEGEYIIMLSDGNPIGLVGIWGPVIAVISL